MEKLEQLLSYTKFYGEDRHIQRKQTQHRLRLMEAFDVREGDHVLEVGCGQGDTTVVLADAVGENGHVHAVDIASKYYGEPITLKAATDYISRSPLGSRITFSLETDMMSPDFQGTYDTAVLSHSLFYFSSLNELAGLFAKLRQLADRICIADWDLQFNEMSQSVHAQAILIQGLFAQSEPTDANIRTIVTKESITRLLKKAGWSPSEPIKVRASDLDDVKWEMAYAKELTLPEADPAFSAYQQMLVQTAALTPVQSLDSFVINAH